MDSVLRAVAVGEGFWGWCQIFFRTKAQLSTAPSGLLHIPGFPQLTLKFLVVPLARDSKSPPPHPTPSSHYPQAQQQLPFSHKSRSSPRFLKFTLTEGLAADELTSRSSLALAGIAVGKDSEQRSSGVTLN